MLDVFGLPEKYRADVKQYFTGNSTATVTNWYTWQKPRGITHCQIFCVGSGSSGSGGGTGASAAQGNSGSAGSQTSVIVPAIFVPDILYVSVGMCTTTVAPSSVSVGPNVVASNLLALANGGGGAIPTAATMTLGWPFLQSAIVGSALSNAFPATGVVCQGGGTGGIGGASGAVGSAAPGLTSPVGSIFPSVTGAAGSATATSAGANGSNGFQPVPGLLYFYGGMGGGGGGGSAGGAGGAGGRGGPGCGGGGGGGGFTTGGAAGLGGDGFVIIISW